MKYINYEIKNMTISRVSAASVGNPISGAMNYFGVHFDFDEEFSQIAGAKACEFYKNRKTIKVDLVDGQCAIPNEFLADKTPFEMRVVSGTMIGTPWIAVTITESGTVLSGEPEEEAEPGTEYVRTVSGDEAVALFKAENGKLMFSQNGKDFIPGLDGVPEVPATPKDATYVRKNGDWVEFEAPQVVEGLAGTASALTELDPAADLQTAVAKINEIIALLVDRGVATQ